MSLEKIDAKINSKDVIAQAKLEIHRETMEKGVNLLKGKYRELMHAQQVVANIEREIANLELKVEQGSV